MQPLPLTPSPTGEGEQVTFTCSVSNWNPQKAQKVKVTYSPSPVGEGVRGERPQFIKKLTR